MGHGIPQAPESEGNSGESDEAMPKEIGIDELGDFLEQTAGITAYPQSEKVMQEIVELTKEQLYTGFQNGTAPDGSSWPALKHPRPPRRNQNNKPLLDSYRLLKSVTNNTSDHVEGVSDEAMTLGTYVEYGPPHQDGTKDGILPARPFMGFSERTKDQATEDVADDVIRQIDKL